MGYFEWVNQYSNQRVQILCDPAFFAWIRNSHTLFATMFDAINENTTPITFLVKLARCKDAIGSYKKGGCTDFNYSKEGKKGGISKLMD